MAKKLVGLDEDDFVEKAVEKLSTMLMRIFYRRNQMVKKAAVDRGKISRLAVQACPIGQRSGESPNVEVGLRRSSSSKGGVGLAEANSLQGTIQHSTRPSVLCCHRLQIDSCGRVLNSNATHSID